MAAAKVHTDRFPLQWNQVEPSKNSFNWSETDQLVGSLAAVGIRPAPFVWGSPGWAGTGGLQRPPVSASSRSGLAGLPEGGGRPLRAGRAATGDHLSPAVRVRGHAAADHLVADLERAQPEGLLLRDPPTSRRPRSTGSWCRSPTTRSSPRTRRRRSCSPGSRPRTDPDAFNFLNSLYARPPHQGRLRRRRRSTPTRPATRKIKTAIQHFRSVMTNHGDKATPLWITEFAWGSGPPDSIGINKGLSGQATALTNSFKMLLANRTAWNLQRVFWFLWRDPQPGSDRQRLQLLRHRGAGDERPGREARPATRSRRSPPRPRRPRRRSPAGRPRGAPPTTTPRPSPSSRTRPARPSSAGSTPRPFAACSSPLTAKPLTNGSHKFNVKAIDAAGNESNVTSRSFKVG